MEKELAKIGDGLLCPIAVFVKDGRILTGHRHYKKENWKEISVWTIPGGRSQIEEIIEQTLRREVAEEIGITEFEIVAHLGTVPGAKEGDIVLLFLCTTKQEATLMEPEKFSEWRWVSIKNWADDTSYMGFNPDARKMITEYILNFK